MDGVFDTFRPDATGAAVWSGSGRAVLTIWSAGDVVSAGRHGRTEDVCAMLA
jgi:hypothetical protein